MLPENDTPEDDMPDHALSAAELSDEASLMPDPDAALGEDWYGPDTATFGDRLAAAREAAGLSQKELARRLGVKHGTVRGWEDDLSEPRANKLAMMAGLLNVTMVWLLSGEGDGVAAPVDESLVATDINGVLVEIRAIKTQISAAADRLGRLEKTLRMKLKGE